MGGTINLDNQLAQTITTGSAMPVYDHWPWSPNSGTYQNPSVYYYHTVTPPVECSGDVHVFPCPHCEKCKCGAATVKRGKKKSA